MSYLEWGEGTIWYWLMEIDSTPCDWICADFPRKTKITPYRMLSNPWMFSGGSKMGDGQMWQKGSRSEDGNTKKRGTGGTAKERDRKGEIERDRECGGGKDGGKKRERKRGEKRRGETAVGGWMGVSMVILSSFSTCKETMVLTMFSVLLPLMKQRAN